MAGVKPFLVLAVAALDLAVVPGRVRTNELMPDTQLGGCGLEKGEQLPFAVGETVGEFNAVVCLHAFHPDAPAGIPLDQPFQEVSGGVGGLLRVSSQEAQAGELVNGSVLEQAKLRVRDASAGHHLYVHLDTLAWVGHLLIGLGLVGRLLLCLWEQPQLPHHPEQTLRAAGITSLPQTVPQLHHAQIGVAAAHIPDQLQFLGGVLVGMTARPSGLTGQGRHTSIPARFPEVDVRPAFVVLPAGTADAVFLRVFH